MNTPRVATVLVHAPEAVSDQQLEAALRTLIRRECEPRNPAAVYPDAATVEVHLKTVSAEENEFLRTTVFGAS